MPGVVRRNLLRACCAGLASLGLASCAPTHDWDYTGDAGPTHWGELDRAFVLAERGGSQSPVNILTADVIRAELPRLSVRYGTDQLRLVNNGHTVKIEVGPGHMLSDGARNYELAQFHFHAPSEHTIDSRHAQAEFHFVHAAPDGHLAVLAVLIERGPAATGYQPILDALPTQPGPRQAPRGANLALRTLLPAGLDVWAYDGSLTTPPATEGVRWFVLREPVMMSDEQIDRLRSAYDGNNRPVQPLHARWVLGSGAN
ncbi:MAG: carbonic anhydrase family protein [Planctomycetota bacterium]